MNYTHIVFDVDGTLLDTEQAILEALQQTILDLRQRRVETSDLAFVLGIPTDDALERLGLSDVPEAEKLWTRYTEERSGSVRVFAHIRRVLETLAGKFALGIVTSRTRKEFGEEFASFGLTGFFSAVVCADDTQSHKPAPDPLLKYLEKTGAKAGAVLYIGDSVYDMECAAAAGVDCALAQWGCKSPVHIRADYYLRQPSDVLSLLLGSQSIYREKRWLSWAMELQFIAQAGLAYSKDAFDLERFQRIREISSEIMGMKTGFSPEQIREVFCNETGFQTPKLDTRAAIFKEDKILLVREKDGLWALPGGWVDVNQSIRSNTVKEVKEEAGLDVTPLKLIALQDRNLHNTPPFAYGVCKAFVLCACEGGSFEENPETSEAAYFSQDELPLLSEDKTTAQQIALCFEALHSPGWEAEFE